MPTPIAQPTPADLVAAVAQRLGRRWLGAELNPAYAQLIEQRTRGTLGLELTA